MTYFNNLGQARVGWKIPSGGVTPSTLWSSIYSVWNADTLGTSLDSNIFRVYNGDNVNDSSGNAQNGTLQGGLTFTTGKVGNAFTFNGTSAAVRLPDNSLNSLTGDFSISGWVYLPYNFVNTGGATMYMLWNVTAPTWANNLKGIALRIISNTIVNFLICDGVSNTQISFNDWSSTYLKNSNWVHITATRKGSTGSKLYLNGVLVASNTSTMNPVYSSTFQTPNIGNLRTTDSSGNVLINNDFAFNGTKLDGLTIWTKELTASEVFNLYNDGTGTEYPFTNQTLASLKDSVGTNDGTRPASTLTGGVPGPTFTTGKIGKAFNFDGINDIVSLSNNSLDLTGDFSISMWVNWGRNNTSQILMSNFTIGASFRGWFIEHAAGQLRFRGFNSTGGNAFFIYTAYTPPLNTWVHYTFVHKNNSNKMYADGVLIGSDIGGSTHVAYDTPNYPMIGANQYNATTYQEFFLGKIDAVSVWNRELTAADVTDLYNSGNGKQYPY